VPLLPFLKAPGSRERTLCDMSQLCTERQQP
jgi:hypothetical protein